MRRLALIATAAVAVGLAGGLIYAANRPAPQPAAAPAPAASLIGGPFQLIDAQERPVTEASLLGKPTAVFFGFTYCPDVCPTTLAEITAAMAALGPAADRLNVVFVSVDPERDTPAQMRKYLASFDPRIQGYTGTVKAVDAAAKAYRVYHRKVPIEGGGYTVDHSSAVYLFDREGRFVEPIGYGTPQARMVAQLKSLAER